MSRGIRSRSILRRLDGRGPSGTTCIAAVLSWILLAGVLTSCDERGPSGSSRVSGRDVAAGPDGSPSETVSKPRREPVRSGPWRGTRTRDFGLVSLVGNDPPLTHVFTLMNDGEEPIYVLDVKASCGCTAVAIEDEFVAPGHPLRIATSLQLSDSGPRQGTITVLTDHSESPVLRLFISAVGRRVHRLTAVPSHRVVTGGSPVSFSLHAMRYDCDETPAMPRFVAASPGCPLETRPWSLLQERCPERGLPSRWETTLLLSDPTACLTDDRTTTEFRIVVEGLGAVTVSLRDGRPVPAISNALTPDAARPERKR